jgi:hypothetical protein
VTHSVVTHPVGGRICRQAIKTTTQANGSNHEIQICIYRGDWSKTGHRVKRDSGGKIVDVNKTLKFFIMLCKSV